MSEEMDSSMKRSIEIYVRLLNEGTEVFRPTRALDLGDGRFQMQATEDYDPALEAWEFVPGSIVRIGWRSGETGLYRIAIRITKI